MKVITIPLSQKSSSVLEDYQSIYEKVLPIGVGYKKYLDSKKNFPKTYCIIINTHNEINIHYVVNGVLNPSISDTIREFSIEYLIDDLKEGELSAVSKLINVQLNHILTVVNSKSESLSVEFEKMIYLENSTDYMNYFNKVDDLIITDKFWKIHENSELAKMVFPIPEELVAEKLD